MFIYHFFLTLSVFRTLVELIYDMSVTRGITKPTTPLSWSVLTDIDENFVHCLLLLSVSFTIFKISEL